MNISCGAAERNGQTLLPKSNKVLGQCTEITVYKMEGSFNKSIAEFFFKFTHHTKIWWWKILKVKSDCHKLSVSAQQEQFFKANITNNINQHMTMKS